MAHVHQSARVYATQIHARLYLAPLHQHHRPYRRRLRLHQQHAAHPKLLLLWATRTTAVRCLLGEIGARARCLALRRGATVRGWCTLAIATRFKTLARIAALCAHHRASATLRHGHHAAAAVCHRLQVHTGAWGMLALMRDWRQNAAVYSDKSPLWPWKTALIPAAVCCTVCARQAHARHPHQSSIYPRTRAPVLVSAAPVTASAKIAEVALKEVASTAPAGTGATLGVLLRIQGEVRIDGLPLSAEVLSCGAPPLPSLTPKDKDVEGAQAAPPVQCSGMNGIAAMRARGAIIAALIVASGAGSCGDRVAGPGRGGVLGVSPVGAGYPWKWRAVDIEVRLCFNAKSGRREALVDARNAAALLRMDSFDRFVSAAMRRKGLALASNGKLHVTWQALQLKMEVFDPTVALARRFNRSAA